MYKQNKNQVSKTTAVLAWLLIGIKKIDNFRVLIYYYIQKSAKTGV